MSSSKELMLLCDHDLTFRWNNEVESIDVLFSTYTRVRTLTRVRVLTQRD